MGDQGTVDIGHLTLAYRVFGDPDAPPLVLLHALGENAADWDEVAAALAGRRRVYAVDLRGHGASGRCAAYSLELMRDDVLGFLDALGIARADLVGHSMGGVVAYLLAMARPDRVVRLVLEDVPPPWPREPAPLPVLSEPLPFDPAVVPPLRGQADHPDPAWLAGLPSITAPTLVVAGGPPSHVPQDRLAELARRIPDCRLVTVPVGHLVHSAAPARFIEEVTGFLLRARTRGESAGVVDRCGVAADVGVGDVGQRGG